MKYSVVVVTENPTHAHRLRAQLDEAEELDLADLVTDSGGVVDALSRRDCQILLVDESVAPVSALEVIREVSARIPYVATLLLSTAPNPDQLEAVVDSGGRGVVGLDEPFEEIRRKLVAAGQWSLKISGIKNELGGLSGSNSFVVTLLGSKGGVGTTSLALHTARLAKQQFSRVCLLDLDTTKSDLASFAAIPARRDLADLAAVGDALSVQAVQEVVFADATGLNILCSPSAAERAEDIDSALVRGLLITLRQMYDVVVVDAGGAINDVAATALELADEAVVVLTPDMVSVRGTRQILEACERLDLRDPAQVKVLVNRASARRQLQPAALQRMIPAPFLTTTVPSDFESLEDAVNRMDPDRVREGNWLRAVRGVWTELAAAVVPPLAARNGDLQRGHRRRGRRALGARGDDGVVTVEFLALLPLAFLVIMGCVQLICYGAAQHQATRSAGAAAHAAARGDAYPAAAARAEAADTFADRIRGVTLTDAGSTVRAAVVVDVPTVLPRGWMPLPRVTAEAGAVKEPGR